MIIQQYNFGTLTIGDCYIIGSMNEGVSINLEIVSSIISLAIEHFKDKPWGYISNRIHSYDLNPVMHIEVQDFVKNLVAYAAVTHSKIPETTTDLENKIHEQHELNYEFATFTKLDNATDWVKSIALKGN